jgi:hypothetical protein
MLPFVVGFCCSTCLDMLSCCCRLLLYLSGYVAIVVDVCSSTFLDMLHLVGVFLYLSGYFALLLGLLLYLS